MTDFERDNAKDPVIRRELEDEMVAEIAEWANRMGYHKANEVTLPRHQALRRAFIQLAEIVIRNTPKGRERALALTNLQQALMWANAGIAIELAPLALDE